MYLGSSRWFGITTYLGRFAEEGYFRVNKIVMQNHCPLMLILRAQDHSDIDLLTTPQTSYFEIQSKVMGGPV